MTLKANFHTIVDATLPDGKRAKFSMSKLMAQVWPALESHANISPLVDELRQTLGPRYYKGLAEMILRNVFLIELVNKPAIETTWMRCRWDHELDNDPRGCTFDGCMVIAAQLLRDLPAWLSESPRHTELFRLFYDWNLIPYEGPLDYLQSAGIQRIHTAGNLIWYSDDLMDRTLRLRAFLRDKDTSPDPEFFNSVLTDKIKVKTYLTDRVLTGDHKTNREKRWETHPKSVHFAERRVCLAIEYALITQLCQFEGFPRYSGPDA